MTSSCSHSQAQRQNLKWNNQDSVSSAVVTSYTMNVLFIVCLEQRKKDSLITERQSREPSRFSNRSLHSPGLWWCKQ